MDPRLKRPEQPEIQEADQCKDNEKDAEQGRVEIEERSQAAADTGQLPVGRVAVETAARLGSGSGSVSGGTARRLDRPGFLRGVTSAGRITRRVRILFYRFRTAKYSDHVRDHPLTHHPTLATLLDQELSHSLLDPFHHLRSAFLAGIERFELGKIFLGGSTCVVLKGEHIAAYADIFNLLHISHLF